MPLERRESGWRTRVQKVGVEISVLTPTNVEDSFCFSLKPYGYYESHLSTLWYHAEFSAKMPRPTPKLTTGLRPACLPACLPATAGLRQAGLYGIADQERKIIEGR